MALSTIAAENPAVAEVLADLKIPVSLALLKIVSRGYATSERAIRRYRDKIIMSPTIPAPRQSREVLVTGIPDAVKATVVDAPVDEEKSALEERVATLTADNRRLFKQSAAYKARGDEMIEAVYRAARDAAEYVGSSPTFAPVRVHNGFGKAEEALWHLTDWQGGKKTISYNRDVMHDRVETFVEKASRITDIQRADHPVDSATLLYTGDMVEGVSIFPGQVWELDGTLFEQMFDVADLMEWTIREALGIYDNVQVVCEWGNHGRLGKKGDGIKASDNVDRMVYEIVRQRLAGEDRISNFQVSGDWYQHFTIGNYAAVAIHGDEIKSFGGNLPAYGILRKANQWASGVLPRFQDLYIGHYHQSMQVTMANGGSVFMTGSPESDNLYAAEFVAAKGAPSQRINFVDPEAGLVTAEYRIWLES